MTTATTSQKRRKRLIAAIVLAITAIIIVTFYALIEPDSGLMPRCPFKMATGWDCPGCGSQRMIHALLHGDISQAWALNPFLFFAAPILLLILLSELLRSRFPRFHRLMTSTPLIASLLTASFLWTIIRNILA